MKLNIARTSALIALLAFPFVAKMSAQNQGHQASRHHRSFDGTDPGRATPDGQSSTVTIPADLAIRANEKATLADIKPGDFVASAADKGPDGKIHAEELRIFPEAMRGAGEGHRPMAPRRTIRRPHHDQRHRRGPRSRSAHHDQRHGQRYRRQPPAAASP